jgi:hypothetical protein
MAGAPVGRLGEFSIERGGMKRHVPSLLATGAANIATVSEDEYSDRAMKRHPAA